MTETILNPVLALVCWSMLIWLWMYIKRIPAMQKAGIKPQDAQHPGSLSALPSSARSAADNYNHLMEQPTIFYALAFYLHLAGSADALAIKAAWAYVILRVLHSFVQITANIVMARFSLFALSSLVLAFMAVRAVLAL